MRAKFKDGVGPVRLVMGEDESAGHDIVSLPWKGSGRAISCHDSRYSFQALGFVVAATSVEPPAVDDAMLFVLVVAGGAGVISVF